MHPFYRLLNRTRCHYKWKLLVSTQKTKVTRSPSPVCKLPTTHSHLSQLLASLRSPERLFSCLPGAFVVLYSWLPRGFCLLPENPHASLRSRPSPSTKLSITLEWNCFGVKFLSPWWSCLLYLLRQPVNSRELFLAHAISNKHMILNKPTHE